MKKLVMALTTILVALTLVVSCNGKPAVKPIVEEGENDGYVSVYLSVTEDYYSGESMTLSAYMAAVKTAGKLEYESVASDYGAYLTSVNGRAADSSKNEFWSIYTSNKAYDGEFGEPYTHNDVTLYSANVGMDSLPVAVGETVMFILMTYSY